MERLEAANLGLSTYTTGRPCKNGHLVYRYTKSGACSGCISDNTKQFNAKMSQVIDQLDLATHLVYINVHINDMPTIKAVLDGFVTGFHPDSINPYPFKKVKYFGDGSVARVQVRIPHGKFDEINKLANSLRILSEQPIKSPDFSVLPMPVKRELPDDFENI